MPRFSPRNLSREGLSGGPELLSPCARGDREWVVGAARLGEGLWGGEEGQRTPGSALPFRQSRVWTHRYLPARGSGEYPRSCSRHAAPRLQAPIQAAAGLAQRGLRLAPPNFPSPSVGRGGSGGEQAGRDEARPPMQEPALAGDGSCAPKPSTPLGDPRPQC
uniref:Uncharacterized protein n=1 Tax=Rousettus aegyptiacus TaxID=9407 RepID=A0A7J8G9P0_ROUAE|nr:hypothetical protein HJG63_011483 [Rousettus aegyptiacus]